MGWFTPEEAAILRSRKARIGLLCELKFTSETIRLWNGDTYLEVNGKIWSPLRGTGMVDGFEMVSDGRIQDVTLSVPGADMRISALAINERGETSGRNAILYIQFFDDDWQAIFEPKIIFIGWMQTPKITRTAIAGTNGATQTISIGLSNIFFNRSRPPLGRFNDSDQQRRYPGDQFFSFASSASIIKVTYPDYS